MYEKVLWSLVFLLFWDMIYLNKEGLFGSVSLDIIDVTRPEMLEGIQGPLAQLWRGVFNGMRWCLWHGDSTTLRMPTSGSQGHRGNCCRNFCSFTINISSLKCPVWVWTNVLNLFEAALLSFVWPLVLVKFNHMCFVFKILKFLRSDDFYTKNRLFPYGLSPNDSTTQPDVSGFPPVFVFCISGHLYTCCSTFRGVDLCNPHIRKIPSIFLFGLVGF